MRGRLGALAEPNYRLLFSATLITSLGDAVAVIALAFAVLAVGDATDLGIVLAARQGASAVLLLAGGVIADRLPRNRVLAGASLLQGAAQAATAAAVLTGSATVPLFAVLAALFGIGDGVVMPAEVGVIPETVSSERLQQANALQGLSRSATRVVGPALGGVLVVTAGTGWALALDAASFAACALLLARIELAPRAAAGAAAEPFLRELREGWREFVSRAWLWSTVLLIGVANAFGMFWMVLGPAVAEDRLGGARSWAAILTAGGIGAVAGGILALRIRPVRPLVACLVWSFPMALQYVALLAGGSTAVVAAAAFTHGVGVAVGIALWFTVFHLEIPERARSRVSSYDALMSFVLTPIGAAIAGPIAAALGTAAALGLAAGVIAGTAIAALCIPAVWAIRAPA